MKPSAPRSQRFTLPEPDAFSDFITKVKLLLAWLYPELRPYRSYVVGSWILLALLSAVSASPIVLANYIVRDFQDPSKNMMLMLSLLASAILAINILNFLGSYVAGSIGFRLRHALEVKLTRHMIAVPLSYYERCGSGTMSLVPFTQIPLVTRVVNLILTNFVQCAMTTTAVVVVMFFLNLSAGIFCMVLIPLFFMGANLLGRRVQRSVANTFKHISDQHSYLLESLLAVKSIRTLGISKKRIEQISRIAGDTLKNETTTILLSGIHSLLLETVFAVGIVALVLLLRSQFIQGVTSLPMCVAALTGFGLLAQEMRRVAGGYVELRRIVGASYQVIEFITQPFDTTLHGTQPGPTQVNEVRMDQIAFSYGDARDVLCDVDMTLPRGSLTGIVGSSGAGKSTIADILLRLRMPKRGRVLVNDVELRLLSEQWLRDTFGFVDQEPFLFNTSIKENLLLTNPELSDDDLMQCLRAASAMDFVSALPDGLNTRVGEGGCLLSVGEKQRIALARALAKRPQVLVLDEVTSALDADNERVILQALRSLAPSLILVLISHKVSVYDYCDRIYEISCGRATLVK